MAPKKRAAATGPPGPAKARKSAEDLERLGQRLIQQNPHVKMLEKWMFLG